MSRTIDRWFLFGVYILCHLAGRHVKGVNSTVSVLKSNEGLPAYDLPDKRAIPESSTALQLAWETSSTRHSNDSFIFHGVKAFECGNCFHCRGNCLVKVDENNTAVIDDLRVEVHMKNIAHLKTEDQLPCDRCKCDIRCLVYGDCCFDFFEECLLLSEEELRKHIDSFQEIEPRCERIPNILDPLRPPLNTTACLSCVTTTQPMRTTSSYKMVSKCPIDWTNAETREYCENIGEGVMSNIPVNDPMNTGHIFKNMFCAQCHGRVVSKSDLFTSMVQCSEEARERVMDALNGGNEEEIATEVNTHCQVTVEIPVTNLHIRRRCDQNISEPESLITITHSASVRSKRDAKQEGVVMELSNDKHDMLSRKTCPFYSYPIRHSEIRYKNPHCASVDNLDNYVCDNTARGTDDLEITMVKSGMLNLHLLFNFKDSEHFQMHFVYEPTPLADDIKNKEKCTDDEVYSLTQDACVKVIDNNSNVINGSLFILTVNVSAIIFGPTCPDGCPNVDLTRADIELSFHQFICNLIPKAECFNQTSEQKMSFIDIKPESVVQTVESVLSSQVVDNLPLQHKTNMSCRGFNERPSFVHNLGLIAPYLKDLQLPCVYQLQYSLRINHIGSDVSRRFLESLVTLGRENMSIYNGRNKNRTFVTLIDAKLSHKNRPVRTCAEEQVISGEYTPFNSIRKYIYKTTSKRSKRHWSRVIVHTLPIMHLDLFDVSYEDLDAALLMLENCSLPVMIDNGSFNLENNYAHFQYHKQRYKVNLYVITNGKLIACLDNVNRAFMKWRVYFSDSLSLLTIVGFSVSIVSLAVTFFTYSLFSSLRNVPGLILMCLTVTLTMAMLIFLVGVDKTEVEWACVMIACLLHFCWLSAFSWMNVLSYDLTRTFAFISMPQASRRRKTIMYKYVLVAIGVPLCIVIPTLLAGCFESTSNNLNLFYGNDIVCWINQSINGYVFGIPVGVSVFVNICFFVFSVCGIYRISRGTRKVRRPGHDQWNVLIYIKLSLIMGLSWALFYIAMADETLVMYIISTLLNAFQGVFIFIVFVCKRRVLKLYTTRYFSKYISGYTGTMSLHLSQTTPNINIPD